MRHTTGGSVFFIIGLLLLVMGAFCTQLGRTGFTVDKAYRIVSGVAYWAGHNRKKGGMWARIFQFSATNE